MEPETSAPSTTKPALRMTSARQARKFASRLLNQLRNDELTAESAAVQIRIVEVLLSAIRDARKEAQTAELD